MSATIRPRLLWWVLTLALALPGLAAAQAPDAAVEGPDVDALQARRAELALALGPEGSAVAPERRELLQRLDDVLRREVELRQAAEPEPAGDDDDPPEPTVFALNATYEELAAVTAQARSLQAVLETGQEALIEAEAALRTAQQARRQAADALESAEPALRGERERALETARVREELAEARLRLRRLEARQARSDARRAAERQERLRARVDTLRGAIAAGGAGPGTAALATQERSASAAREAAQRQLRALEVELTAAQQRYAAQPSPALLEELKTLALARDARREELEVHDARLTSLERLRTWLSRWGDVIGGRPSRDQAAQWRDELDDLNAELQRAALVQEGRVAELRELEAAAERERAELAPDDPRRPALARRVELAQRALALHRAQLDEVRLDARTLGRVADALDQRTGELRLGERLADVGRAALSVWRYEVTVIDDRSITVATIVIALLLLGVGFAVSRRLSRLLGNTVRRRFRFEAGAAAAIETLAFYALLIGFTLASLRTVNFPLTAFTILGGALAIGLGFGSQNVMNNFISGLIIMLERPIRSGDLVELQGTYGVVEGVGARSTRIRASDNSHLIVPNSYFLENTIVNWTLSDDVIRTVVTVGIVYGSPTRQAEEIIRRVLDENPNVLKDPPPTIIFNEFGDNSLNFDMYFYVRARSPLARARIESEVRFAIDDEFRKVDIVIAFPQRDVHLDTVKPLDVRVVDNRVPPR